MLDFFDIVSGIGTHVHSASHEVSILNISF